MVKGTTKSQGKKHSADKFYTKPEIAQSCIDAIPGELEQYDVAIEPSAGSGSFSSLIPDALAFDLHPEAEGIIEQDWLTYSRERDPKLRVLVFGNPPFGQQNSLAVKFINQAAMFANTVAFILPMSFKKPSVQNRLHPNLHLAFEMDLPKKAFELNGEDYAVPCVFQVWEYKEGAIRAKPVTHQAKGFSFTPRRENPDFSVQRVGGRAGFASSDYAVKSIQSHYFVKLDTVVTPEILEALIADFNASPFPSRNHSVGPRSISKGDVAEVLNKLLA